jgi:hypothetical protein
LFLTDYLPPEKRRVHAEGGMEARLTEGAVMLAFAKYLLDHGCTEVRVHPDGEHAKTFDLVGCLASLGFVKTVSTGGTSYGGRYERSGQIIHLTPASGRGDVVGDIGGRRVIAECKGGTVNSSHNGQRSRVRKGFHELMGQLLCLPIDGARHVAVIPHTTDTARLAERAGARARAAGIEIALVERDGSIIWWNAASSA